jgi:hypothetical protein
LCSWACEAPERICLQMLQRGTRIAPMRKRSNIPLRIPVPV